VSDTVPEPGNDVAGLWWTGAGVVGAAAQYTHNTKKPLLTAYPFSSLYIDWKG